MLGTTTLLLGSSYHRHALLFPPFQVFLALRQLNQQYMEQPDLNACRGALLALGIAVETCQSVWTCMLKQPFGRLSTLVLRTRTRAYDVLR